VAPVALAAALLCGCATSTHLGTWSGPDAQPDAARQQWTYRGQSAQQIVSAHYTIHTTIGDPALVHSLANVMEGAFTQYQRLAPGIPATASPMDCYFFASRPEWEQFTRVNTGNDASVYLRIVRGGYTVGDRFVAYYIGNPATFSVAAHEGFHQFAARHFKGRLPPFLEEGFACTFEAVRWSNDLPRWNLSINPNRAYALRKATDEKRLWSLEHLITMHAGNIVSQPSDRVEAFYAQNWAFAKFLREAEGGKYHPAMERLLRDTADGTVYDPTGTHRRTNVLWNPAGVRPLLEHYLDMDLPAIERAYRAYVRRIVYEDYRAQFPSS
jgi:hypothetical protein